MTGIFYSPYATDQLPDSPGAQAAQREYAKALMTGTQGKGGAQFPVVQSWTQGASNMVNALMGGLASGNADYRDRQARLATTGQPMQTPLAKPMFGATAPPEDEDIKGGNASSFSEGPTSEGRKKSDGEGKDLSREANAIASIESKGSGDYSAMGPQTRTGDRAYGKYQVMGANVGPWTQEVLGKAMTPEEFMRDPAAQDKVFQTKFAQGGNNDSDRASVWFTGKPLAQGAGRSDGYINGQQYVDRFNKAMGGPGGSAMAFAGPDQNQSPAVTAMSAALKNDGTQVAANAARSAGSSLPQPNGTGIYVDPRLVPKRPPISPEQMQGMMTNPWLTPEAKAGYLEQFRQQSQPVEVPYPGGKVVIDPRNPTRQQFIPDLQKGTNKVGDVEVPSYGTVGPGGAAPGMQFNPMPQAPVPTVGPRSEAVPPAAPTAAPNAPNANVAANAPPPVQSAPAAPQKPVQVASADPAQAFAAAAQDGAKPDIFAQGTPQATPATPLAKFAQSTAAPPGIPQQVWDMYTQKKSYDQQQAIQQKQQEADIDVNKTARTQNSALAAKRYDNMQAATQSAYHQLDNLRTASRQLQDPEFYSGLFANEVEGLKKLGQLFGGDPNSSKPMEVFRKTMASQISDGLKAAYGGLGQIRNKEIELSEKANGSLSTSLPANLALVEIAKRSAQRLATLGEMGTDYRLGHEVVDPISGKVLVPANATPDGSIQPRVGLDPGYDKAANQFVKDHPMFSDEEYKNFDKLFDKSSEKKAEAPASTGAVPAEAAAYLKANPGTAAHFDETFGQGAAAKVLGK